MNIEDIKVGEWYNVPFKVKEIKSGDIHLINGGIEAVCQPSELSVIGEASMPQYVRVDTSNDIDLRSPKDSPLALSNDEIKEFTEWLRQKAESAPKYDPNRKFRKGDKVRFKEYLGRRSLAHTDEYITLDSDERQGQCFWTGVSATGDIWPRNAYFCYLELVEPVEELEPYRVVDAHTHWDVADKDMKTVATYSKGHHPNAKAAAEAERDRLNAE